MAITIQSGARALLLAAALAIPSALTAQVGISVAFGPPSLPVYAQPICPGEGYLWTPGYWAYGPEGYYWVPGTWVLPPRVGYLWTPAYWAYEGSAFNFHPGYWGPHIGFYGGINYGFGYGGVGYEGGYWRGNAFAYNRSVNNIGNVRNVYDHPVELRNGAYNHVSYNGGRGGVPYRPSPQELGAVREQHFRATGEQQQHQFSAAQNRQQFARFNNGRPAITAAPTPNAFRGNPNTARGGFGGPNPARPSFHQPGAYPQQGMANRGGFNAPQRQPMYRDPNAGGRPVYRENRNGFVPPQQRSQPEFRQQQQQRQPEFRQAAPRNEGRPAPAPRGDGGAAREGGHEGRRR